MNSDHINTLCVKHVYGAALTEAEKPLVDAYSRTPEGQRYLREVRQIMQTLQQVAEVPIKPVDHEAMIQRFEQSVRQTFDQAVIRPRGGAYSLPMGFGLLAGLLVLSKEGISSMSRF